MWRPLFFGIALVSCAVFTKSAHHVTTTWDDTLAGWNCTANYSTALSVTSRGNNGTWVTSPTCFNAQMQFLSVAACEYFAAVDCAANCNEDTETAAAGSSDVDEFNNPEHSYCNLFCQLRDSDHPEGGSTRLGCAHSDNATRCNCSLTDCDVSAPSTTTMASTPAPPQDMDNAADVPPSWCELYCQAVVSSCEVKEDISGCGFAEARATLTGSLVNISRVLSFSVAAPNATHSAVVPSLSSVCSTADTTCNGSSNVGCNISSLHFDGMGTESAVVTGTVSGLIDAPVDDILPSLLLSDTGSGGSPVVPEITIEPQLHMLCLGAVRACGVIAQYFLLGSLLFDSLLFLPLRP